MAEANKVWAYHRAPSVIQGDALLPLNSLRTVYPDLYAEYSQKYLGREGLMRVHVEPLGCEWSDLLMFSLCDPRIIIDEYRAAGNDWPTPGNWLRIDPERLDQKKLLLLPNERDSRVDLGFRNDEFVPYSAEAARRLSGFSEKTRQYYRTSKKPLIFLFMPHLLYRGVVPLAMFEPVSFD